MTRQSSRRRFLKATAATGVVAGFNVAVLAQDEAEREEVILLGAEIPGWRGYRLPGEETVAESKNPPMTLQAGATYTLIWYNLDGEPHNIAFKDSDGNNLQVLQPLSVEPKIFEQANQTSENESVSVEISDGNVTGVAVGNETENVTDENVTDENVTDGNMTDEETPLPEDELVDQTEIVSGTGTVQAARFTATEEMAEYICLVHPNTMVADVEIETGDDETGNNSSG